MSLRFRTECNKRSKYFDVISEAYKHFYKCIAERKSVELWAVGITKENGKKFTAIQELVDCAYFS